MARIFISYRRIGKPEIVETLYRKLTKRFGVGAIFVDVDKIYPGSRFKSEIVNSIKRSDVVLAIIDDGWISQQSRLNDENDFVRIELEHAISNRIPVIPVIVDKGEIPQESNLPGSLKSLLQTQAFFLYTEAPLKSQINNLIRQVDKTFPPKRWKVILKIFILSVIGVLVITIISKGPEGFGLIPMLLILIIFIKYVLREIMYKRYFFAFVLGFIALFCVSYIIRIIAGAS